MEKNGMVNEIGEGTRDETEPLTITLGKHVTYNPSPFMDRDDLMRKTIIACLLVVLGIALLYLIQILGILTIVSALFLYGLSFYETRLLDKWNRQKLR
jgi:hypothetical protein